MYPDTTCASRARTPRAMIKLVQALEDHDDVQNVYANYDIDDALMEQLSACDRRAAILGIDPGHPILRIRRRRARRPAGRVPLHRVRRARAAAHGASWPRGWRRSPPGCARSSTSWRRRGRGRGRVPRRQRALGAAARPLARRGAGGGGRARAARARVRAGDGEARGRRQRRGDQGAGAGDGARAVRAQAARRALDASDALAVAICHAFRAQLARWLQTRADDRAAARHARRARRHRPVGHRRRRRRLPRRRLAADAGDAAAGGPDRDALRT